MLVAGKRLAVFAIKKINNGNSSVWTRAGSAWVNKDGSMNINMDVLPLDGRLHVREAGEVREAPPAPAGAATGVNSDGEMPAMNVQALAGVAG